ncbi:MAG: hypothetical protein M1609_17060, partial [Firmicutes bacterium]|nr:hypothetical protein [Bacillota bacterium]
MPPYLLKTRTRPSSLKAYNLLFSDTKIDELKHNILSSIEVYNTLECKYPQVVNLDYKISDNL